MIKKILCAIDDTEDAMNAVVQAAEFSFKTDAPLTLCMVNALTGGLRGPQIYMHDDATTKKILDNAASLARQHGVKNTVETELKGREISTAVIQYAEQNGFDHIVVGTGDKRGLSRLVLGSVAADIAGRAHCTVTVAR